MIRKISPSRSSRSPERRERNTRGRFSVGEKIEAKVKGWTRHYPGKIAKKNHDGSYDLQFDDGDFKR